MADLWLANVDTSASDEEIKAFLVKYGFPEYDAIQHMPGDGSRPAVLLSFHAAPAEVLRQLQPRLHNLYWKNRRLQAQVMAGRFG
jgi:hypothetical protein